MSIKEEVSLNTSSAASEKSARRWPRRLAIALTAIILIAVLLFTGFIIYASQYYHDADTDRLNLTPTASLPVEQGENYVAFGNPNAEIGLIFYPGAKVEYSAYSPLMRNLAQRGYFAVVVEMPFNFAFFGINAAQDVRAAYPQISSWWVGGHSLGGSMAAQYAADRAGAGDEGLDGLILLASYTASDLSASNLGSIAIYGSNDQVLNQEKLMQSEAYMPANSEVVKLAGGNHALFGNYGTQEGDGEARITAKEQEEQTAELIDAYIKG